jgi:uncharacterized protein YcfL
MKKISFLFLLLALMLILSGCGGGDKSPQTNEPAINTAVNEQPAANVNENKEPTAAKYNNIFFGSTKYDPENKNCYGVYWVHIPGEDVDPLKRNLNLLLAGPTQKWLDKGYFSSLPAGTKLNWVKIENNTISADFSAELNTLTDSCAIKRSRQQIENTLRYAAQEHLGKEIKDLKVVISVEGQIEGVLKP